MEVSRKRLRSDENCFILQSKKHVDEKVINLSDLNKMQEIYSKTINILFKASKTYKSIKNDKLNKEDTLASIILNGSGSVRFLNDIKIFKELKESQCCKKPALILSDCSNCNLQICEYCAFSCVSSCGAILCYPCITLFECGKLEEPICKRCNYLK